MLFLHLTFFGLAISWRDYQTHLISKRTTHLALLTLIPFIDNSIFGALLLSSINLFLYMFLKLISPQAIGRGDVRLSLLIGSYVSAFDGGVYELIWCNTISWVFCSISLIPHFLKQERLKEMRVAFAPYLFFGLVCYVITS
ncbi:MAG: prepilin peptidase [Acidobacteria bacterium]|nr:prepilin peptidase [Acidobacteriota bacterium]